MSAPTPSLAPPSGEQYEIGHGRQRAVVTEVGATLRVYAIDDSSVIDGFDQSDLCPSGRGQVLAPWPNRLGDGRYALEGRSAQAALDEPDRVCAIHGLVRWLPWQLISRAQNVVLLGCTLHPQPGYPWRLSLSVEYRLGRTGLMVSTEAVNLDQQPAPFGLGFHPYLALQPPAVDVTYCRVPAMRRLIADERGLPTGEAIVAGSEYDFTESRMIGSTRLDTAFTGLTRDDDGTARVEIGDAEARTGVTLWMDDRFRYIMVYTADTVDPARRRQAIAVEPMTCPPDALRSGIDLVRLMPGVPWRCTWGISPRPARRQSSPSADEPPAIS